ncbi:hypothetical protein [Pseudoxanthomonas gei]|uniref:hypothetical protein n=1 Tax=Pseudoxanthomonas gei TaxID=1383030 RepID=UPI001391EF8D|nr:hypothetical protein [Pseudoxanthomonas gei]
MVQALPLETMLQCKHFPVFPLRASRAHAHVPMREDALFKGVIPTFSQNGVAG